MAVFSRSWSLFTATWQVLKAEKTFVLYPIFAAVAALLVTALAMGAGVAFLAAHPELEQTLRAEGPQGDVPTWVTAVALGLLFLYYLAVSFVVNFFMTALVGAALERLRGSDPGVADGLRIARRRAGAILGYSLIAATVGVLLSLLRGQRQQGIGALLAGMGGLAWGVATFLVLPVLAAKGIGPVAAIRESAGILRKTWGEQLTGTFGMGAAFAVALFLTLLATIGLVGLAGQAQLPALAAPILLVGGTCLVVLVVLNTTLMGIYRGAIYLYAEQGEVAPQFDRSVITQAFAPRSK